MSNFLGLFGDDKSQNTESENKQTNSSSQGDDTSSITQDTQSNGSLQLHKEELDITKNNVDAGQVVISKDVVEVSFLTGQALTISITAKNENKKHLSIAEQLERCFTIFRWRERLCCLKSRIHHITIMKK